jgi:enoyl-CoA hydratase/carnithine racemase
MFRIATRTFTTSNSFENIIVTTKGRVGIIQLNRPKALNALNTPLMIELNQALNSFDANESIGAIVLTGSEKAFAAGADIKEMKDLNFISNFKNNFLNNWTGVASTRKPVLAAVNGFALGGGCELSMMCDLIYAGDKAKFGQPEIKLGVIAGAGGTQRLTRAVGKARAMDMNLTGVMIDANEAKAAGLVARVYPAADLLEETIKSAELIASYSLPSVMMAKVFRFLKRNVSTKRTKVPSKKVWIMKEECSKVSLLPKIKRRECLLLLKRELQTSNTNKSPLDSSVIDLILIL